MQYIKEDVENMLKQHKENEGKILEIELKLEEYQQRLDYAGTVYEDTEQDVIENMQLTGQTYDSVRSNTNKISDKVSNTALNYHKEQYYINKEDRTHLANEIKRLLNEKDILDKKVVRVKNWLDKINEKESFILIEFYINNKGKDWNKVVKEYNKKFDRELTDRQLRTTRDKAIQNVLKIVNV